MTDSTILLRVMAVNLLFTVTGIVGAASATDLPVKITVAANPQSFLGLFDTRNVFGHFEADRSRIVLRIDDDIQIVQRLNGESFTGLPMEIAAGDHRFAVVADVVMRNVDVPHFIMNDEMREYPLKAECSSVFHIDKAAVLHPVIVLDTPTQAVQSFQISQCALLRS